VGKAILLATGGYGRVFARSTNALINTGDGAALAIRAGVPLRDMEFVQFHPTTLYGTNILITEGARGEGGYLFNNKGERFMKDYAPKAMDLAPRDIVARAIQTEVDAGNGFEDQYVHLDLTHLGADRIKNRLPGIRQISMDFAGVDPITDPIPVQPGQHYSMGGISCETKGSTSLPGLFTAGEAACVSVHGANRLGGNSLLETVVFGKLVGQAITEFVKSTTNISAETIKGAKESEQKRLEALISRTGNEHVYELRDSLKQLMFNHFGVFREENNMKEGHKKLKKLQQRFKNVVINNKDKRFNYALVHTLELENMLLLAEAIALGAIERKESRGSHSRPDFPDRNDEHFLKHTLTYYRDGKTILEYGDVKLGKFPVKERVY
jgi:succinate dehydrogenase / fumarate reductase flavoprotein subunit